MKTAPTDALIQPKSISGDISRKKAVPDGHLKPRLPEDPPFDFQVIFSLGKRYLAAHRWLVVAYVITSFLCRPVIPVTIALLFSQLTNFFENQKIEQVAHEQQLSTNANAVLSKERNDADAAKKENAGALADSVGHPPSAQDSLLRTYLLWLALTLALVGGMPLQRYLVSVLDGKIGNTIRRDVFDSVLRQSPGFFFKYDSDRLTVVVNQLCIQAQLALRQLLIDPILQVVSLVLVGCTLYSQMINLPQQGGSSL
jgi:ABC-type multidrug transport system fused ATPase/permease subunit